VPACTDFFAGPMSRVGRSWNLRLLRLIFHRHIRAKSVACGCRASASQWVKVFRGRSESHPVMPEAVPRAPAPTETRALPKFSGQAWPSLARAGCLSLRGQTERGEIFTSTRTGLNPSVRQQNPPGVDFVSARTVGPA